jgi:hypothetical protein
LNSGLIAYIHRPTSHIILSSDAGTCSGTGLPQQYKRTQKDSCDSSVTSGSYYLLRLLLHTGPVCPSISVVSTVSAIFRIPEVYLRFPKYVYGFRNMFSVSEICLRFPIYVDGFRYICGRCPRQPRGTPGNSDKYPLSESKASHGAVTLKPTNVFFIITMKG